MVTASLVVETTPGKIRSAGQEISAIPGVTVHNFEGYRIILTVRVGADSEFHDVMATIENVDGVVETSVIYRQTD